jgi:hypothetical protein
MNEWMNEWFSLGVVSSDTEAIMCLFYQRLIIDDPLWVIISGIVIDRENLRIRRTAYPSTTFPTKNTIVLKACVSGYILCIWEGAVSSQLGTRKTYELIKFGECSLPLTVFQIRFTFPWPTQKLKNIENHDFTPRFVLVWNLVFRI